MPIYIKFDGIDSPEDRGIEIESFSWGVADGGDARNGRGGGVVGRPHQVDINVTKTSDAASPKLMLACASGKHIHKAEIDVYEPNSDGNEQIFLKVEFADVLVDSFSVGGSRGSEPPIDTLSLDFLKVELSVGESAAGWDFGSNRPL